MNSRQDEDRPAIGNDLAIEALVLLQNLSPEARAKAILRLEELERETSGSPRTSTERLEAELPPS